MGKIIDFTARVEERKNQNNASNDRQLAGNINIIKEIMYILKNASIKKIEDVAALTLDKNKLLSAQRYSWIGDIAELLNSLYYETEKYIGDIDGQIFLVDEIEKQIHQDILKYSCVFPDRMIISSGEFHFLEDTKYSLIDIDFFRKLFWGKELLMSELVRISPFYLYTDSEPGSGEWDFYESLNLPDKNRKKIAQLDKSGFADINQLDYVDKIFIGLPWLYNVDIRDYLDIIKKNENEFVFYNQYLANLSDATQNTEEFLNKFLKDFHEASINIQIALEKKQAELKTKGVISFLSLCITAIPIICRDNNFINSETLSAILGGGTVAQLLQQFNTIHEKRMVGKENPFWVLWKWKNV